MTVTLRELDSRVFMGLAGAAEFLDLEDIHNAVVQELNLRTMQSRSSDINVLLGTTEIFHPTDREWDITALIGKAVPCWLETRSNNIDNGANNGTIGWQVVRVVNLHNLNEYRQTGAFACAFHGDETDSPTAQPIQWVSFTYAPNRDCRIRFDRDDQRQELDSDIVLPDNLSELIVLAAQNRVIGRIKFGMAMRIRQDPTLAASAPLLLGGLDHILKQNMADMLPLIQQWKIWAFRDRAAQTNFNKPTPSGRGLYPFGRNWSNRWGGGGGGNGGGY